MSGFFGKKKTTKNKDDFNFVLRDIDVVGIDKQFNMKEMNIEDNIEIVFDVSNITTSIDKLGISSLKTQPITTTVQKEKIKMHTFIPLINYVTQSSLPTSTTIPCYGCHRRFDTVPLGVPIEYYPSVYKCDDRITKKLTIQERESMQQNDTENLERREYFDVEGIVCSFNCMYNVIEDNPSPLYKKSQLLIPHLYRIVFGEYPQSKIQRSPSWKLREEYGGCISDGEFVANMQIINFADTHQVERLNNCTRPVGRVFKVTEKNK